MSEDTLIDSLSKLKIGLLAKATDGEYTDKEFKATMTVLMADLRIEKMMPDFIKNCRNTADFRRGMQSKFDNYAARRKNINDELEPVFQYLNSIKDGTDIFFNNAVSYELCEKLGNGGFGTVYRYHHELLDYDFAIKLFEPMFVSDEENIEGEKRFFREAKVLFQLNHKNIVRVFDIGRIEGQPFIRIELIDGYNLQKFVEKYGTVSFERSVIPISAILEGLCYAHNEGVIHRDLKPTNVMVTKDSKFKIIDFGISAYMESEKHSQLTNTGKNIVGGPYGDPILIDNPKLKDARSDIYSVGAIWYYLIVGRSPAGGDIRQSLLSGKDVTPLQADIILKCLSRAIDDRFNTCEEILSRIQPLVNIEENSIATSINVSEKKITEITRDEIKQLLIDTNINDMKYYVYGKPSQNQENEKVFCYYGRKSMIDFLKRVYNFEIIPSYELDFEKELIRHTINNDDYDDSFVFDDERLQWFNGEDELILRFVAEIFHPLVRNEKSDWKSVFEQINELLKVDGYELYETSKISNRSIYSYRYYI